MQRLANYIDGERVDPIGGAWIDVTEPATGAVYAQAAASDASDVDRAVGAASGAFGAWSSMPAQGRSDIMMRVADLIDRETDRLALAESIDNGKPLSLAKKIDIPRAAANFRFFAGAILHSESSSHETDRQTLNYTLRKPRGVAGLISPWNLPLYLLTWKIAPAIAAGNTCVAKPSEVTPMTAHLLCDLLDEAGMPPGVVNIVHGMGDPAGKAIVEHPDVPTLSFTGSTGVGRWIGQVGGDMLKRVSLELGGKNPNVIFADADMDKAIETATRAAFTNQGQICLCGSRLLVQRSVFDEVVAGVVERAKRLVPGDPLEPETGFGALVSADHLDKVDASVQRARELGGTVRCGGVRAAPASGRCAEGFFYAPTVITGLDPMCEVEQNEIFGPVVSITPFDTEAQAVAVANSTQYGLASMVWTRDLSRAHRVAGAIDAGIVWVNCWLVRDLRTPFGGMKQSGVGREGGWDALRFFTEAKNVCLQIENDGGSR